MARSTTTYDIVLSCPTDVEKEKEVIKKVIDDFNRTVGNNLSINLNLKNWSTDSFAQSREPAQNLLNKQFIDDADMIICIFWGRMGTPTERYESGTAEEMLEAIEKGKQVFLYFSNAPVEINAVDAEQLSSVREFKKKIQEMQIAYYKTYNDLEEFKSVITTDLNLYFIQMNESSKRSLIDQKNQKSNIVVSGVKNKKIIDSQVFENISLRIDEFLTSRLSVIKELLQQVNEIELSTHEEKKVITSLGEVRINIFETAPYEYPEEYIEVIRSFAEKKSIVLSDNFFEVGDLCIQHKPGYMNVLGGGGVVREFTGSQDAKNKQSLVKKVFLSITEYLEWLEYANHFRDIGLVRLSLSNQGTIFETDITVLLKFPKNGYIPFKETNPPGENILEMINENDFVENFFGDVNSVEINSFDYPTRALNPNFSSPILSGYRYKKSYESMIETYFDMQEWLSCYEEYEEEGDIVQKYSFKELKQYTSISFPTALLFSSNLEKLEIEYEIISRENPSKKQGNIKLDE